MAPFGNRFQCLGVCWMVYIWDILVVDGDKFLNIFTVIVD